MLADREAKTDFFVFHKIVVSTFIVPLRWWIAWTDEEKATGRTSYNESCLAVVVLVAVVASTYLKVNLWFIYKMMK